MKVIVSQEIERVCPEFVGACVEAQVVNTAYCKELWQEIEALGNRYRAELTTESLKQMTSIAATRRVCHKKSGTVLMIHKKLWYLCTESTR